MNDLSLFLFVQMFVTLPSSVLSLSLLLSPVFFSSSPPPSLFTFLLSTLFFSCQFSPELQFPTHSQDSTLGQSFLTNKTRHPDLSGRDSTQTVSEHHESNSEITNESGKVHVHARRGNREGSQVRRETLDGSFLENT